MERLGVLIENGVVQNIIVWSDESEAQYEADGWDHAIETTGLTPRPGIGWTWSEVDGFRPPQRYPSWLWSDSEQTWVAPTPIPTDGDSYTWDEPSKAWVPVQQSQD